MFSFVLSIALIFSSSVMAQGVDFDKQFPLSDEELNYPLIGENGELPSEMEARQPQQYVEPSNNPYIPTEQGYVTDVATDRLEFENQNAIAQQPVAVYEEPKKALGYKPVVEQKIENEALVNQPMPPGTKSFSIEDLKRTAATNPESFSEEDLIQAEKVVSALEDSIGAIIDENPESLVIEQSSTTIAPTENARPLIDFPDLIEQKGIDVSSYGLLNQETGGFNVDAWRGLTVTQSNKFIDTLNKGHLKSYVLKEAIVNLLLTKATAPEGKTDTNWLAVRANALHNLGEVSRASLLFSSAGINASNVNHYENMAQVWVENKLMDGKDKEVCPFIRQNILNTDNPFWHQALLTCQALARDLKGLELSTNMLTEKTRRGDPLLFSLFDAIQEDSAGPLLAAQQKLKPLHSVIYAESPKLLTPNVLPLLPDAILLRIAKNVTLPQSTRLQAAENLVNSFNATDDIALLGLLYEKSEFDAKIVESPGVDRYADEEVDGSLARSLLWQASKISGLSSSRALTLKALWKRADNDQLHRLAARLTPRLRKITADTNLAWLAPEVIARSLRYGDVNTANNWWKTLKKNRSLSKELVKNRNDLEIVFAFVEGTLAPSIFEKWFKTKSLYDDNEREVASRILTFLEASEIPFPANVWQDLHDSASGEVAKQSIKVSPLWLRLLGSNLEEQKIAGSFVLLSEPLLKASMPNLSIQTAGNIVTAFRFLGMNDTARNLVLEAVLTSNE